MSFITWSEELSVGNNSIDQQHQKLIQLANDLYDAMSTGKGKEILGKLFSELIAYTDYHFKTEQDMMNQYRYPESAIHFAEHSNLTSQVLALDEKFKKGSIMISVETMNFLKTWLSDHILRSDKALGFYIKTKI